MCYFFQFGYGKLSVIWISPLPGLCAILSLSFLFSLSEDCVSHGYVHFFIHLQLASRFSLFKRWLIYLFEGQSKREGQTEFFHPLVYSLNGHNTHRWLAKAKSHQLLPDLSHGCTGPSLGPFSTVFLGILAVSWIGRGPVRTWTSPIWGASTTSCSSTCHATTPAPHYTLPKDFNEISFHLSESNKKFWIDV